MSRKQMPGIYIYISPGQFRRERPGSLNNGVARKREPGDYSGVLLKHFSDSDLNTVRGCFWRKPNEVPMCGILTSRLDGGVPKRLGEGLRLNPAVGLPELALMEAAGVMVEIPTDDAESLGP